jgi:hypothetical protein
LKDDKCFWSRDHCTLPDFWAFPTVEAQTTSGESRKPASKAQDVSRTIQYCSLKSGKEGSRIKPTRVLWIRKGIQDGEWPRGKAPRPYKEQRPDEQEGEEGCPERACADQVQDQCMRVPVSAHHMWDLVIVLRSCLSWKKGVTENLLKVVSSEN